MSTLTVKHDEQPPMPATVIDIDGHPQVVLTESDALDTERKFRSWLLGVVASVIVASFWVGVYVSRVQAQTDANHAEVVRLKEEGSVPVQTIKTDIAVIKSQQVENGRTLDKISSKLDRIR